MACGGGGLHVWCMVWKRGSRCDPSHWRQMAVWTAAEVFDLMETVRLARGYRSQLSRLISIAIRHWECQAAVQFLAAHLERLRCAQRAAALRMAAFEVLA